MGLKGGISIDADSGFLVMFFDAAVAFFKKTLLLFRLALAILCSITKFIKSFFVKDFTTNWTFIHILAFMIGRKAVLFHLPFIIRNFITKKTFVNHFHIMDTDVDIINISKISGIFNIWEPFFLHEHQHCHYSPQLYFSQLRQQFHLSNDSSVNTLSFFLVILLAIFEAIFCAIFTIFTGFLLGFLLIFTGFLGNL